jgi:DNA-binding NarL/FixJ family response regulator
VQNKFLIVERHPLFADALASCIEGALSGATIERAQTLAEAKTAIYRERGFDLILLDLSLPDTYGFGGLIELRKTFPGVPVAIISGSADQNAFRNAIICGAVGIILKSACKQAVLRVIADVLSGRPAVPPDFLSREPGSMNLRGGSRLEPLTEQQLRVLHMLCNGLYNKQIAYKLDVQTTTVKSHVTEILRKLHVGSRTQAVIEVSKSHSDCGHSFYVREGIDPSPIASQTDEVLAQMAA